MKYTTLQFGARPIEPTSLSAAHAAAAVESSIFSFGPVSTGLQMPTIVVEGQRIGCAEL